MSVDGIGVYKFYLNLTDIPILPCSCFVFHPPTLTGVDQKYAKVAGSWNWEIFAGIRDITNDLQQNPNC
jgi:hypothetical protein